MLPDYYDNQNKILKDGLVEHIGRGDRISVAAALFPFMAIENSRSS